jgi:hypothetical protein
MARWGGAEMEMRLERSETELVGRWELKNGHVEGDATEKRITWLVMNVFKQVAFTGGGYEILYQDPGDGRYWELTFPQPQGKVQGLKS